MNLEFNLTEESQEISMEFNESKEEMMCYSNEAIIVNPVDKAQFLTMVFTHKSGASYISDSTVEEAFEALAEGRNVIANVDNTDYIPLLSAVRANSGDYLIFSGIYNTNSISFNVKTNSEGVTVGTLTANNLLNSNGTASKASKLATARTFIVNLASTLIASFDGTKNVTLGVTGKLPITNGGTGAKTAEEARKNIGAISAEEAVALEYDSVILKSSTKGSTKKFRLTVDDIGALAITEV